MKTPRTMSRRSAALLVAPLAALTPLAPAVAHAQEPAAPSAPAAPPSGGGTTTVTQSSFGVPSADYDPNSHLGRGSQAASDINASRDGFDLNRPESQGATARGGSTGQYILDGSSVPPAHTVKRGDTLWAISGQYYRSPYNWPKVWSYNEQILNPHWIYPGDRVRLREESKQVRGQTGAFPPRTVFLRDVGWIDDPERDAWGELVGAPGEHLMLGDEMNVYVQLDEDRDVKIGDKLTIFRPLRAVRGGGGDLVSVRGTLRVDRYNPKTGMAKGTIVESLDVIERGNLVGPVKRQFHMVPPVTAEKDLEARIAAALYPHAVFGDQQVLFIDRGKRDGVVPGMRFFALEREDKWVKSLSTTTDMARTRARQDRDEFLEFDKVPTGGPAEDYPDETYAELRVIAVRDDASMCLVVASKHEIERGAYLTSKKGF